MLASIMGPDLLIVVLVAAVVLFGGSRIPKLARSLGSAQKEFKHGLQHGDPDQPGSSAVVVTPSVTAPAAKIRVVETPSTNGSLADRESQP
jgi:sec-independent protein translocase protein TatA